MAHATRFDLDYAGETLVVLSFPDVPEGAWSKGLTEAERHVAVLALDGATDREIALARGTSVRTVANQMRSVFRKLNCCSRAELAARVWGSSTSEGADR